MFGQVFRGPSISFDGWAPRHSGFGRVTPAFVMGQLDVMLMTQPPTKTSAVSVVLFYVTG
jgi:hypothetical protein